MQELRNILVPTDFSRDATNALVYAINLAEQIDARLYILHVKDETSTLTDEEIQDKFEQAQHDFLFRRTLRTSNLIREGKIENEISGIIKEKHIDLMVMGMKGISARQEEDFGSITAHFIENQECSLLSVPGDCRILNINQMAVASDYETIPDKAQLYTLAFIAQAFSPKVHIFNVKKQVLATAGNTLELKNSFNEIFKYNLHSFHEIDKPGVIGAIRDFIGNNNIDLLAVLHKTNDQKDPLKRSVSKQLAFVLKIPLLIVPIPN